MSKYIPYPFYHDDVPIDISFVFENEKPAGKHGFLKRDGSHFRFEDGTIARFWGTNFNGGANFPDHEYAQTVAKRLAKTGINIVRFHQLDSEWNTPNIFSFTKGKRVEKTEIDPESIERLDYLIYCLKNEGIYCYMDMYTYRKFKTGDGVENAESLIDAAKPYGTYSRKLIELQKDLCRKLWTHKNPYTGLAYCDDPVFVMAEVVNESDLFKDTWLIKDEPYKTEFLQMFDKWLSEKGINKKAEEFDLADFSDETLIDFKIDVQTNYYREMMSFMREIGIKIPITGTNWISSPGNIKTQSVTDYLDGHPYFYSWKWGEFEKKCMQEAITQQKMSYLANTSLMALHGKPMFVSEWDMPWPNEYRAESPIYSAAVGMLQGWSGFIIHTYAYGTRLDKMNMLGKEMSSAKVGNTPYREGVFSTWNDPAKFGLFYHAALITRRGDVAEAKNELAIKPKDMATWNTEPAEANIEKSKIVTSFDGAEKNVTFITEDTNVDEVTSDTGELYRSWKKNIGYIDTPKTKCAYGFLGRNEKIDMSGVSVRGITDFAVVAISSLTDKDIKESDNMLLTTVGRAQNTDFKSEGELILDFGKPPVIAEVIEAEIEIETEVSGLSVWAVNAEGFYTGTVPSYYKDGKLVFKTGDVSQSIYYLIVKE